MVKADAKRDYYADLELPNTAEYEEIKRQFRLLAKLYHPDRNPGHEAEFVGKFQALQAAHEILCDPAEKKKYDLARAKHVMRNPPPPPPPRAAADPYGFSKPTRAATTNFPPPPMNKAKPTRQYTQAQEAPASAGAAKFAPFTRTGNQTWDRQRFEDAARAEAARGFQQMRNGQQTPEAPPRPPRPHPTAPRPASSSDMPMPNGANPGFPGMSRTASARRTAYEEVPRSAYQHVHARTTRAHPSQTPADHWTDNSPPKARTATSPLRHTKSSEPAEPAARPGMFDRQPSRYASTAHVKTDLKEGLYRSSSVRNSPIDPQWEDCAADSGPFGRPRSHQPPPRHRSASPNMRATSGSTADFSESDSGSSDDEPVPMADRKRAQPRRPKARAPVHDGMDTQASFKNYTRVVHEDNGYVYPPPEPKAPTRAPFPNVTSPDEVHETHSPFRYALSRTSSDGNRVNGLPSWAVPSSVLITKTNFSSNSHTKPDPVFREGNFKHDWAEVLRSSGSTSPTKASQKTRGRSKTNPGMATEPMDVDMGDTASPAPQTNGVGVNDLNDLKTPGLFGSTGLNGVDDLKTHLPFPSRASNTVNTGPKTSIRLRTDHLPKPPKEPIAPVDIEITQDNWTNYCKKMRQYMFDWRVFERRMVEHFAARQQQLEGNLADDWIAMKSDGPPGHDVDESANGTKGGFRAYTDWLADDKLCHHWWEAARIKHATAVAELGHLRGVLKGQYSECDDGSS